MICLIDALLEGLDADAAHGVEKTFMLVLPLLEIHVEQLGDRVRHRFLRYGRTDDFAERRRCGRRAPDGYLVPLLAVLIDAQDADVTDVMVPAGIHAARHLDLDGTQVVEIVQIVEMRMNLLRDRYRAGIGETAEIESRAADHVRQRADIRGGELEAVERLPEW